MFKGQTICLTDESSQLHFRANRKASVERVPDAELIRVESVEMRADRGKRHAWLPMKLVAS